MMTTKAIENELLELERQYWMAMKDKDVEAAMRNIRLPKAVEPTLAGVEAALKTRLKKGVR